MKFDAQSIRPFIGARDFQLSRQFYADLGFHESEVAPNMSLFRVNDKLGFYLQDAYVPDWINNSMLFLEVGDVNRHYEELQHLGLHHKYTGAKLSPVVYNDWGKECFLHDPSGILWHFGEFY